MRWPWISRGAHELLVAQLTSERDALREQVGRLQDAVIRIQRHDRGMSEVPREARPAMEPMPRRLLDHFNSFGSKQLGKFYRDEAYRRHARGELWEAILAEVLPAIVDGVANG